MALSRKRFPRITSEEQAYLILSDAAGFTINPPEPPAKPLVGYERRKDILSSSGLSNNISCPEPFLTKREDYRRQYYNRMGAVIPPVPVRKRVPDSFIIKNTPCASRVTEPKNISAKHNVFYDVRTGEIVLVVLVNSKADQFYTRYYEGKATFPYIAKMRGEEMRKIAHRDIPPVMLVVNDEPVFWGYGSSLATKMKNNTVFVDLVQGSKSCWLQLQPPMICEPVTRPHFDVARLRFVLSLESTIKREVKS